MPHMPQEKSISHEDDGTWQPLYRRFLKHTKDFWGIQMIDNLVEKHWFLGSNARPSYFPCTFKVQNYSNDAPWAVTLGSDSKSALAFICFPSRKSVVTFLILLDWKNIANMVWSGESFDARALQINLQMPYGLHPSLNLFPINVYWIFHWMNTCETGAGKKKARYRNALWQHAIIVFLFQYCYQPETHGQLVKCQSSQESAGKIKK